MCYSILENIPITFGNMLSGKASMLQIHTEGYYNDGGGGGHLPYELRDEVEVEREVHHGDH